MARAPRFKVYDAANVYQAACKDVTIAAAVVSLLGEGATVRIGHAKRSTIWHEGQEDIPAGESYDMAADTMLLRITRGETWQAKAEPLPYASADDADLDEATAAQYRADREADDKPTPETSPVVQHGRRCSGCHQELGDGEAHTVGQCPPPDNTGHTRRYGVLGKRSLTVPERHQLRIARETLKLTDAMAGVLGGPTKPEAREIIERLTGKAPTREELES